jgi:hypothetical protein
VSAVLTDRWFIKFENVSYICILPCKSPSETLQMLEDAYGKVIIVKMQVYKRYKRFHMAVRVSKTTHAAGNHQIEQIKKTQSMCAMLCQVTNGRVFKKYQLETFKVFIPHKDLDSWFHLRNNAPAH